jgi:hypothetical protein
MARSAGAGAWVGSIGARVGVRIEVSKSNAISKLPTPACYQDVCENEKRTTMMRAQHAAKRRAPTIMEETPTTWAPGLAKATTPPRITVHAGPSFSRTFTGLWQGGQPRNALPVRHTRMNGSPGQFPSCPHTITFQLPTGRSPRPICTDGSEVMMPQRVSRRN